MKKVLLPCVQDLFQSSFAVSGAKGNVLRKLTCPKLNIVMGIVVGIVVSMVVGRFLKNEKTEEKEFLF